MTGNRTGRVTTCVESVRPRDLNEGDLVERWYDNGNRVADVPVRRIVKRRDGNSGTYYSITLDVPALLVNKVAPTFRVYPNGRVTRVSISSPSAAPAVTG